jgi:hypothetical protein
MLTVELAAKPVPVTVSSFPTEPLPADSDMSGLLSAVTVKGLPIEFPNESVALTVCRPFADIGTTISAKNDPPVFVVTVLGPVCWGLASNDIVIVELAAKPVPVTMTVVPSGPVEGNRVIQTEYT